MLLRLRQEREDFDFVSVLDLVGSTLQAPTCDLKLGSMRKPRRNLADNCLLSLTQVISLLSFSTFEFNVDCACLDIPASL